MLNKHIEEKRSLFDETLRCVSHLTLGRYGGNIESWVTLTQRLSEHEEFLVASLDFEFDSICIFAINRVNDVVAFLRFLWVADEELSGKAIGPELLVYDKSLFKPEHERVVNHRGTLNNVSLCGVSHIQSLACVEPVFFLRDRPSQARS